MCAYIGVYVMIVVERGVTIRTMTTYYTYVHQNLMILHSVYVDERMCVHILRLKIGEEQLLYV